MNRYSTTKIIKTDSGKRRLETTILPPVNNGSFILIRTTSTERLDKLAQRFYGDPTAWPIIAEANGIGKGTIVIPPNTRLQIPTINDIDNFLNNINSRR
jgi:hypothetical protein